MVFGGFLGVKLGLDVMAVREMGVMTGAFVFARFVARGLAVMIRSFCRHIVLSFVENRDYSTGSA
jgi:hypothetical protein